MSDEVNGSIICYYYMSRYLPTYYCPLLQSTVVYMIRASAFSDTWPQTPCKMDNISDAHRVKKHSYYAHEAIRIVRIEIPTGLV